MTKLSYMQDTILEQFKAQHLNITLIKEGRDFVLQQMKLIAVLFFCALQIFIRVPEIKNIEWCPVHGIDNHWTRHCRHGVEYQYGGCHSFIFQLPVGIKANVLNY